jgi:hypothetical protein
MRKFRLDPRFVKDSCGFIRDVAEHILPLREYEGIKILSPSDFVKLFLITIP